MWSIAWTFYLATSMGGGGGREGAIFSSPDVTTQLLQQAGDGSPRCGEKKGAFTQKNHQGFDEIPSCRGTAKQINIPPPTRPSEGTMANIWFAKCSFALHFLLACLFICLAG